MSADADPLAEIRQTFFQECEELLGDLERGLMALNEGDRDPETINLVFRAVHSVKGGAGAFGLDALVRFAHAFEEVLEDVRSARRSPTDELTKTMLVASDVLTDLVREARGGPPVNAERSESAIAHLKAADGEVPAPAAPAPAASEPPPDPFGFDFSPVPFEFFAIEQDAPGRQTWTVTFTPAASLYARAGEPAILLREVAALGEARVSLSVAGLPKLDELDPEEGYLDWTVTLETDAGRAAIEDVFAFVDGDCTLSIGAEPSPEPAAEAGHEDQPPAPEPVLVSDGPSPAPERPVAVAAAKSESLGPAPVRAAAPAADPSPKAMSAQSPSIRVELDRIDKLVDIVGELVINQAMLAEQIGESGLGRAASIVKGLEDLEHLTRDLQESVMAIRAQPVRSVFQRMPRLVREVASMCGKEVRLVTEGEGTEVDKTVIERLSDPIVHMVRNAIDHGLESTERRLKAGKSSEGTVRLAAAHRSGRIVIEVGDDGGGIDRERVLAIAVAKGLVPPTAQMSDEEIDNLIFLPGFSTASTVSDISGRGVGMDVVRSSIAALGGRISISSRPGLGSTFTMSLPLTLAVLDGMVVTLAGETLVVPLTAVVETLQAKPSNLRWLAPDVPLLQVRDVYIPLIDVGTRFGYREEQIRPADGVVLLVETGTGLRVGLLVDAIQGQRQVVIKSLEANYKAVDGVAAATILGDGRIALIVDVDAVTATSGIADLQPSEPFLLAAS